MKVSGRHTVIISAVATLALTLAACSSSGGGSSQSGGTTSQSAGSGGGGSSGGTVTIGVIEHETGPSAFYGLTEIKGMEAAAQNINNAGGILGKKISLKIVDDADTPAKSVQDVRQLASDSSIPVILGPTNAPSDLADSPVAAQQKIPEIFNTGGVTKLSGDYGYTVLMPYPYMAKYTLDNFFKDTGYKTAAIVTQSDNPAFTDLAPVLQTDLKTLGVNLVANESYQQGTEDFSSIIAPIRSKQPQAVILNLIDTDAARFVSQARQAGVKAQWVGSTNSELTSAMQNAPNGSADNMVVAGVYNANKPDTQLQQYLTTTKKLYGNSLLSVAVYGYDSVYLLKDAVQKAGGWSRSAINDALKSITSFQGAAGTYQKHDDNQFWQTQPPLEILKSGQFQPYKGA